MERPDKGRETWTFMTMLLVNFPLAFCVGGSSRTHGQRPSTQTALPKPDLLIARGHGDGHPRTLGPSSFVRMTVGSRGMFVGKLAMVESRSCVLLRLFVLAKLVMMGRLVVMMGGSVVVSGGVVVMLARRMLR
jgi:hypothetical protein